ncbi:hypothetical protein GCM10009760_13260 [Kitasatospora kazusensis]|uniref:Short subunit dehydrogenase n=1 Tax=Kitasatospora kazusensis TaxID=407974 RepID=A0ABP5KNQ6_9ACTN
MSATPPPTTLTALVMDGATGPGRIVSTRLSAAGVNVAVVTVSDGGSAAYLSKELTGLGLTALPYQVDLDDPADVDKLLSDIAQDLGPLDLVVDLLPPQPPEAAATGAGRQRAALLELLATACKGGRLILLADPDPHPNGGPSDGPYDGPYDTEVDTVPLPMPLPGGWSDPAVPPSVHQSTANAVLLLLGLPTGTTGPAESTPYGL